jgi:predicted HTH domain antitoxin
MLAKVCSVPVNGIEAYPVEAEVNAGCGDAIIVMMDLPETASLTLKAPKEGLEKEPLFAAPVKPYEPGRLSSGAAAEVAGVPKPLFVAKLADYGVCTFDLKKGESQREMKPG